MSAAHQQAVVIGPFRLDLSGRRLTRGDVSLPVGGRALDVLAVLASAAGTTVGKSTLLDQVWPGVAVEENSLQVQISALRKVLGEGWIVTVPGRGYRLMVPHLLETRLSAPGGRIGLTLASLPDRPSIAVLPFTNMSSNPDLEFFSEGIAEDLITELSRNRSLFVVARSSSFTYKGPVDVKHVANELGVRYVLEGSTRRDGERVRINAQLVDAQIGNHLWADRYDRNLTDVFAVQDEITRAVVIAILPAIAEAEHARAIHTPTANLNAWEAYHRGLWHVSRAGNDDVDKGLELLSKAVALDRAFVEAHASLARFYLSEATRGGRYSLGDGLALAELEARTALRLDDTNANAHASLAWVFDHRGDQGSALHEANQAISLNANDPAGHLVKGHILTFAHRSTEAKAALETALRLDPRGATAPTARHHLAAGFFLERDYASAVVAAREAIRVNPDFPRTYLYLVASLGQLGRLGEAHSELRRAPSAARNFLDFAMSRCPPWYQPDDYERLVGGLRKAGW